MGTLSSSEAVYVGISEVTKYILHIRSTLKFLNVEVKLPISVKCEKVGAIYLSKNNESRRIKHIDMKYHFVHEYVEEGIVKVIFVHSNENKTDPFTNKNNETTHTKHYDYMTNKNDDLQEQGRVLKC